MSTPLQCNYADIYNDFLLTRHNIQEAIAAYHNLESELAELEQTGMYPSVPSEQWQTRNGSGEYLYMLFHTDRDGNYQGPDGKRKIYVGNKPERIEEARRLAANRVLYEQKRRSYDRLREWIHAVNYQARYLKQKADGWRDIVDPGSAGRLINIM